MVEAWLREGASGRWGAGRLPSRGAPLAARRDDVAGKRAESLCQGRYLQSSIDQTFAVEGRFAQTDRLHHPDLNRQLRSIAYPEPGYAAYISGV